MLVNSSDLLVNAAAAERQGEESIEQKLNNLLRVQNDEQGLEVVKEIKSDVETILHGNDPDRHQKLHAIFMELIAISEHFLDTHFKENIQIGMYQIVNDSMGKLAGSVDSENLHGKVSNALGRLAGDMQDKAPSLFDKIVDLLLELAEKSAESV